MPKNEVDPEDPMELHGVALLTEEDTQAEMAACFVEEFLRLGWRADRILALFRDPHYVGPHMVLENRGEPFVRQIIAETFAAWGQPLAEEFGRPKTEDRRQKTEGRRQETES